MDEMNHAMKKVLENMGRAAREGKARRYSGKKPVEVTMGEVTLEPRHDAAAEREEETGEMGPKGVKADQMVDPLHHSISDEDMADMMKDLEVQR